MSMEMSIYAARKAAKASKLLKEIDQYQRFVSEVVAPVVMNAHFDGEALEMSPRFVYTQYGSAARDCFVLLFKQLHRGGWSRDEQCATKSKFVVNLAASQPFINFATGPSAEARTCQKLLKHLKANGAEQVQWYKAQHRGEWSTWLEKDVRDQRMAKKRARDNKERDDLASFRAMKQAERAAAAQVH